MRQGEDTREGLAVASGDRGDACLETDPKKRKKKKASPEKQAFLCCCAEGAPVE